MDITKLSLQWRAVNNDAEQERCSGSMLLLAKAEEGPRIAALRSSIRATFPTTSKHRRLGRETQRFRLPGSAGLKTQPTQLSRRRVCVLDDIECAFVATKVRLG